nr:MAG TPA: hypothetical protein [Caudoviricetes sp.]
MISRQLNGAPTTIRKEYVTFVTEAQNILIKMMI